MKAKVVFEVVFEFERDLTEEQVVFNNLRLENLENDLQGLLTDTYYDDGRTMVIVNKKMIDYFHNPKTQSELDLEEKAKELRRAYYREYRKRNRERIAETERRYWENKAKKEMRKEKKNET